MQALGWCWGMCSISTKSTPRWMGRDILGWNLDTGGRQSRILAKCRVPTAFIAQVFISNSPTAAPQPPPIQLYRFQGLGKALMFSQQ